VTVDGVTWRVQGAQLALVDSDRVLIQFRPWPPGWELPGGHCERGEDSATTAVRETEEETGYRVRVCGLVGVYTWAGLRSAGDVVYLGEIAGGAKRRSLEAWTSRMVTVDQLPRTLFPWCHERIRDALAAASGDPPVHRVQLVSMHHVAMFATAWLRSPMQRLTQRQRRRS